MKTSHLWAAVLVMPVLGCGFIPGNALGMQGTYQGVMTYEQVSVTSAGQTNSDQKLNYELEGWSTVISRAYGSDAVWVNEDFLVGSGQCPVLLKVDGLALAGDGDTECTSETTTESAGGGKSTGKSTFTYTDVEVTRTGPGAIEISAEVEEVTSNSGGTGETKTVYKISFEGTRVSDD